GVRLGGEDPSERPRERRSHRRRRDEVASVSDRAAARVVALVRIVERRAHEVVEGDGPFAGDTVAQAVGEGHAARIIVSAMRRGLLLRALAAASLVSFGCASKTPAPIPTLEDYSDGTSRWVESLLTSWKAGVIAPELFARPLSWSGPLPGDSLTPAGA